MGRLAVDPLGSERDRSFGRRDQAGDGVEGRGFSGAIGTEQCDDGACRYLKRYVGDADQVARAHFQGTDGEQRDDATRPAPGGSAPGERLAARYPKLPSITPGLLRLAAGGP